MQKTVPKTLTHTLKLKTLTVTNFQQVTKFVIANHRSSQNPQICEDQQAQLYALASSIIVPVLRSEWSFGIWEMDRLVGVYLQIDVVDYVKIATILDLDQMASIFSVVGFDHVLQSLAPNLKRGDYLLTLYNFINPQNSSTSLSRNQIKLIYQGFYMCKLGGWKNILFQTYNPYPFLRISAEVVEAEERITEKRVRSYLMRVRMEELCFNGSPFQGIMAKL